jgi:hypothetical protein
MNIVPSTRQIHKAQHPEQAVRRLVLCSIAAAMIASALMGMYLRANVITYVMKYAVQDQVLAVGTVPRQPLAQARQFPSRGSRKPDPLEQDAVERARASASPAISEAVQGTRTAIAENDHWALAEERDRSAALASKLETARRDLIIEQLKQAVQTAKAELQQARDRTKALASELAIARRDVEAQAALSRKLGTEAAQLKQAAEAATAELQQERERTKPDVTELAIAPRDIATRDSMDARQLNESPTAVNEWKPGAPDVPANQPAAMPGQQVGRKAALSTSESGSDENELGRVEVPLSLQNNRVAGKPGKRPKVRRRAIAARVPLERAANSRTFNLGQAVSGKEQPAPVEAKRAFGTRLMDRANVLLSQGDIGAAQLILGRAAKTGSAQATFRLAETFDPLVLSSWRIEGARADAIKARELYATAYARGIKVAKDRSDALIAQKPADR